jgi:integrase
MVDQEGIHNARARCMTRKLLEFCKAHQIVSLASVTKTHLSEFKLTLTDLRSGDSNSLRVSLAIVGAMFRWATDEAGYLAANPFPKLKLRFAPREVHPPTDEEVLRVLAIPSARLFGSLMRYSGMAIRDASFLKRTSLVGNLITARRQKTDNPFRVRIPMWLADELRALPPKNAEYFFYNDELRLQSNVYRFRRQLEDAFAEANVNMTTHGFRHYFISTTLAKGVSVEDVSTMVGTSPNEIRKTYRHWIKEATDRLDDVQEKLWLSMGLDKHGNPVAA